MRWKYGTETVAGNFHSAVVYLNHHPDWDVVTMSFSGNYTTIVYRVQLHSAIEELIEAAKLTVAAIDSIGQDGVGWTREYDALTSAIARAEGK